MVAEDPKRTTKEFGVAGIESADEREAKSVTQLPGDLAKPIREARRRERFEGARDPLFAIVRKATGDALEIPHFFRRELRDDAVHIGKGGEVAVRWIERGRDVFRSPQIGRASCRERV